MEEDSFLGLVLGEGLDKTTTDRPSTLFVGFTVAATTVDLLQVVYI